MRYEILVGAVDRKGAAYDPVLADLLGATQQFDAVQLPRRQDGVEESERRRCRTCRSFFPAHANRPDLGSAGFVGGT